MQREKIEVKLTAQTHTYILTLMCICVCVNNCQVVKAKKGKLR